jgi:hypothetical protein
MNSKLIIAVDSGKWYMIDENSETMTMRDQIMNAKLFDTPQEVLAVAQQKVLDEYAIENRDINIQIEYPSIEPNAIGELIKFLNKKEQ